MKQDRASLTAARVALRRASHQLLDRPLVFEDPLALRVIGAERRGQLEANPRSFDRGWLSRYLRAFLVARSRFSEEHLAAAIARGVLQYVLLGAGLDTSAHRLGAAHRDLRAFEVDHPATQRMKRGRLREGGIATPPNVRFVPVDFERQELPAELSAAGFDANAPAFFAWLGVTMYLTRAAFDETLSFIAARPGGSAVTFDYSVAPRLLSPIRRLFYELMAARVRAAGEPWILSFVPGELEGTLRSRGFGRVEDCDERCVNQRYFRGRSDGLRVSGTARIVYAEVGATVAPPNSNS